MTIINKYPIIAGSFAVLAIFDSALAQVIPTEKKKSIEQLCDGDAKCIAAAKEIVIQHQNRQKGHPANVVVTGGQQASEKTAETAPFLTAYAAQLLTPNQKCSDPSQYLFFRKDSFDNFNFISNLPPDNKPADASASGASINYTDDRQAANQKATFNFRLTYLLAAKQHCYAPSIGGGLTDPTLPYTLAFAIAPFFSSNGTWNQPFTTTTTSVKATSAKSKSGTTTTTTRTTSTTTVTTVTTNKGSIVTTTKKTSTSALRAGVRLSIRTQYVNITYTAELLLCVSILSD